MPDWLVKILRKHKPAEADKPTSSDKPAPEKKKEQEQQDCGMASFAALFEGDDTFVSRQFLCGSRQVCIAFLNGMVSNEIIDLHIVDPIQHAEPPQRGDIGQWLTDEIVSVNEVARHEHLDEMAAAITTGDTVLFFEGMEGAISFNTKQWMTRSISEPEAEKVLRGPREGFNESLVVNTTLIRRRLQTPDLKFEFRKLGRRAHVTCAVCYLKGLVNEAVLSEVHKRLDSIDIDALLSVNYIEEIIMDSPLSMFPTIGNTERPDVVVAKLLEGRIAIMLDGSCAVITAPHVFVEMFQANDDYYNNFIMGSVSRMLRILGFVLTIMIPAAYLSLVTIHHEMVPTGLLLSIYAARQGVPLPTVVELFLMLVVFELLRESGARLPSFLGQSLSIVGGLVLGQAAVQAKFISAPAVIVVAFAGITGLLIPRLATATLLLRVVFLLLSSVIGLYGLMLGMSGLLIYLSGLKSFGVPFMYGTSNFHFQEYKDSIIRAPWWLQRMRPRHISTQDSVRQSRNERP